IFCQICLDVERPRPRVPGLFLLSVPRAPMSATVATDGDGGAGGTVRPGNRCCRTIGANYMRSRVVISFAMSSLVTVGTTTAQEQSGQQTQYAYVWAGAADSTQSDFLAVL